MYTNELLSYTFLGKRAYARAMMPVCTRHSVTWMELAVLLFLANNPGLDTAAELVNLRGLSKSHVSASVASLTNRGLLDRTHRDGNRKTVHLSPTPAASAIIADGQAAQHALYAAATQGFAQEELNRLRDCIVRLTNNLQSTLE